MSNTLSRRGLNPPSDPVAQFLGWFSGALGFPQIFMPGLVNRLAGIRDDSRSRFWQRVVGVREIAAFTGILSQPRPVQWVWARVAGDIKDLALLGAAWANKCENPRRLAIATASVAGITFLDVYEGAQLTRTEDSTTEPGQTHVRTAITVRRPTEDVYGFWHDFRNLPTFMDHLQSVQPANGGRRTHWKANAPGGRTVEWDAETVEDIPNQLISWRSLPGSDIENSGSVRFMDAPGDRGTEIHVDLLYDAPAGQLGAWVAKLFGEDPTQQVKDDLRRFKQVMEAGEVVRSDGTPEGITARRLLRQRPAQPLPAESPVGGGSS
jgi:uncharacterized membrane protein